MGKIWNFLNEWADKLLGKAGNAIYDAGNKIGVDEVYESGIANDITSTLIEHAPMPEENKEVINGLVNSENQELIGIKPATVPSPENNYSIVDKTNENQEYNVNNWIDWATQMQEKQWEREDKLTEQLWAREDSAWQRSVTDMQAAGVNPNLVNASPANSSSPVTSSTGINTDMASASMQNQLDKLLQEIENSFKGDENEKDRVLDLIDRAMSIWGFMMLKG